MEEKLYDYETCRAIWNRVSPSLQPYGAQEEQLPGAQENPCCMGTEALESVEVLRGFVREELCAQRKFSRAAMLCRDASLRRPFSEFSRAAMLRTKKLLSALYLITGESYAAEASCGDWCPANRRELLRELYHEAACGGFNYARAAEETTDECLTALLGSFSREEYRRAEQILDLLARTL